MKLSDFNRVYDESLETLGIARDPGVLLRRKLYLHCKDMTLEDTGYFLLGSFADRMELEVDRAVKIILEHANKTYSFNELLKESGVRL